VAAVGCPLCARRTCVGCGGRAHVFGGGGGGGDFRVTCVGRMGVGGRRRGSKRRRVGLQAGGRRRRAVGGGGLLCLQREGV
jgi:hypothetical protein